ncbi:MAG TPA: hypothetical protein DDZ42_15170 [Candidatus Rokubacteria bacterium]|nr:MAG: hypothetical protein A2050_08205 [Candidatus Rokubacteria bacterium GWA2_73_35]HBH03234.1 hypothetical protein [Candidatus Rokubacteria bacterium]
MEKLLAGLPPRHAPTVERSTEPRQLDLFLDGRDAFLVHEVLTSLVGRDLGRAETGLERLREEHPFHPDLPALALLVSALNSPPPSPTTLASVTAGIEALQQAVAPTAQRVLGEDAAAFLQPSWQALAATTASLPFDEAHPRAHRSWLCQQYGDWAAVRAGVEAEADWTTKSRLVFRLGLARHHLGEPEAAIRLWLPLCWMDPPLFRRRAGTLPSATLREGWQAFERAVSFDEWLADAADPTGWFPAWLLPRHRGLVHLFEADEVPDAGTGARAFRHLLSLVPLESQGLSDVLVHRRRALQQLSPGFFRYYLDVVGRRGSRV